VATIEITDRDLIIRLRGMDKLLALRSKLKIPLDHVRAVTVKPPDAFGKGPIRAFRLAGAYVPDIVTAGFFWVSRGLTPGPRNAIERLERAKESIEELEGPLASHRDKALALVVEAIEVLRSGADEVKVAVDDDGRGLAFYAVQDPMRSIGLELEHERIRRVVIEIEGMTPEEAAQVIADAKAAGASYRSPG
jgi:hypothetical protein